MNKLDFLESTFHKLVRAKAVEPVEKDQRGSPFRCSSLPFCRVNLALKTMLDIREKKTSFRDDFYFTLGRSMHLIVQRWLGRMGLLFGYFVCPYHRKIRAKGVGPFFCSKCNTEMLYEEIEIKTKEGLIGHTDGLLPYLDGYFVFELKSISKERLETDTLPYQHNLLQGNAYGIANMDKGLNIHGVVFLYLARDTHTNYKFFLLENLDRKVYNASKKDILAVTKSIKTGRFDDVLCLCRTMEDAEDCEFRSLCFKDEIEKHLKSYWKLSKF